MARPNKIGLDYFPFDIDFFDDEKISAISGEFGIKGEITVIRLLCAIYRNGYFILWDDLLRYKLLRNLPGTSEHLLESIVQRLVLWGFFDKSLFDSAGVLTSKGIQRRFFSITKRRVSEVSELPYLLVSAYRNPAKLGKNELLHTETPFKTEFLHTETPKVKKSKVKNIPPTNVVPPYEGGTGSTAQRFRPPSIEEVRIYISEKGYSVDAEQFVNFYESKGWMIGKNKMKNWHAAVATWQKGRASPQSKPQNSGSRYAQNNDRHNGIADWQDE